MTRENVERLIEWAREEEVNCRDVIDAALDNGWGDTIGEIQQIKENFRQVVEVLQITLDNAANMGII
jgi:hypothetical protein